MLAGREIAGRMRQCCPDCDFVYWQNPVAAAGVVVCQKGEVLLTRRKYDPRAGTWSIPGGYVEYGETVEETAIRELKEETGLEIHLKGILGVYSDRGPVVRVIYTASAAGGVLAPNDDISEALFFDPLHLPEELAFETDHMALRDWLQKQKDWQSEES